MNSIEEVCTGLVEGQLLTAEAVERHLSQWREQTSLSEVQSPRALVDYLVAQGLLTDFQGEALLAGHPGPFMLGPYRVTEQICASRSGGVFRGEHLEFDQPVSLKVFPRFAGHPEMLSRMGREARIGAELDHANVVRSFQVGHVGDAYYLAMEALHGETLESKLKREGHLPYQTACRLIRDVARGLAHLHANEVIHRDVRPANIWITERGVPKVMEFGAAVDALAYIDNLNEEDTETPIGELIVGRYDYMPPEQVYNPQSANATSDLYALGSTFYHCLTGRPPFVHRDPVRQVLQHVYEVAQPPSQRVPGIPHPIDDTVGGMLAKDPSHRFQKAEDVVFALDQYVEEPVEDEPVVVVDVSPEYLEWASATHPHETKSLSDDTVGVTPELIGFLDFMAARNARARRGGRRRVGNR